MGPQRPPAGNGYLRVSDITSASNYTFYKIKSAISPSLFICFCKQANHKMDISHLQS